MVTLVLRENNVLLGELGLALMDHDICLSWPARSNVKNTIQHISEGRRDYSGPNRA